MIRGVATAVLILTGRLGIFAAQTAAARALGPNAYGSFALGLTFYMYASAILAQGLIQWGSRTVATSPADAGRLLGTVNGLQLMLAVPAWLIVALVASLFLAGDERTAVIISGLLVIPLALNSDWLFNGLERPWVAGSLQAVNGVVALLLTLVFVRSAGDLIAAPLVLISGALAGALLAYPALMTLGIRPAWPDVGGIRIVARAALPLSLSSLLVVVLHYTNNVIVYVVLGASTLGEFFAAYRLIEMASVLPAAASVIFLPRFARLFNTDRERALREVRLYAIAHLFFGMAGAAAVLVDADGIINLIFGSQFEESGRLARVLGFAIWFNFAVFGYTNVLVAFGRDRVLLAATAASAMLALGAGLVLVPTLGGEGAALATVLVDAVAWLVAAPTFRSITGSLYFRSWIAPALTACVVGVVLIALREGRVDPLLRLTLTGALTVILITAQLRRTALRGSVAL